jgi:predicted kinase
VAKLVLLNGPPAVGKSTLARRFADEHPLTLVLEIDMVRALLGAWLDEWQRSGTVARVIALAMARTHLEAGHDVIVP